MHINDQLITGIENICNYLLGEDYVDANYIVPLSKTNFAFSSIADKDRSLLYSIVYRETKQVLEANDKHQNPLYSVSMIMIDIVKIYLITNELE